MTIHQRLLVTRPNRKSGSGDQLAEADAQSLVGRVYKSIDLAALRANNDLLETGVLGVFQLKRLLI